MTFGEQCLSSLDSHNVWVDSRCWTLKIRAPVLTKLKRVFYFPFQIFQSYLFYFVFVQFQVVLFKLFDWYAKSTWDTVFSFVDIYQIIIQMDLLNLTTNLDTVAFVTFLEFKLKYLWLTWKSSVKLIWKKIKILMTRFLQNSTGNWKKQKKYNLNKLILTKKTDTFIFILKLINKIKIWVEYKFVW